ncbi:MAG TPA: hypothetical protein VIF60_10935 [Burkholderiaceae bacterium]|jgi:methionine-rich copper-binding protein CopC
MNTTRFIEASTLVSIGAFCAAAILSISLQGAHAAVATHSVAQNAVVQLAPVTIVGKRLTAAERADMIRAQNTTQSKMI